MVQTCHGKKDAKSFYPFFLLTIHVLYPPPVPSPALAALNAHGTGLPRSSLPRIARNSSSKNLRGVADWPSTDMEKPGLVSTKTGNRYRQYNYQIKSCSIIY